MIKREQLDELIYGGRMARRFTQDSPILPDVWIEYGRRPGQGLELLLTPHTEVGPRNTTSGELSVVVRERLRIERDRGPTKGYEPAAAKRSPIHVAYNISTVMTELWFDELIRVVLPLSCWWHERLLKWKPGQIKAGLEEIRGEDHLLWALDKHNAPRVKPDPKGEEAAALRKSAELEAALPPDVLWMIRVVGTISLANRTALKAAPSAGSEETESPSKTEDSTSPKGDTPQEPGERLKDLRDVVDAVLDLIGDLFPSQAKAAPKSTRKGKKSGQDGMRKPAPAATAPAARIHSISLNRRANTTVYRSRTTIKADSAIKVFDVRCDDLTWAVVDSGIDARHPAFRLADPTPNPKKPKGRTYAKPFDGEENRTRVKATYDFTLIQYLLSPDETPGGANIPERVKERLAELDKRRKADKNLQDITRRLKKSLESGQEINWGLLLPLIEVPHVEGNGPGKTPLYRPPVHEHGTHVAGILASDWRVDDDPKTPPPNGQDIRGICPDIFLYDLRVLDDLGEGDEFNVIAALQFLRYLKAQKDYMAFHGVNLSLSIRHDVANYACGRTPVCDECERLVGNGVVVVAAAGNDGHQQFLTANGLALESYHSISVTDPGNAEAVITVGSTHRFMPHTYGVSYFSSRGPTGDGRAKPDLVAPGEKIEAPGPDGALLTLDGTSMASPHVSGAAALLIARHRELAGQPARIKQILCKSATDLGRERYFQGSGMVDVLRAIQSV